MFKLHFWKNFLPIPCYQLDLLLQELLHSEKQSYPYFMKHTSLSIITVYAASNIKPKRKILLFPEMWVMRKIFIQTVTNLFLIAFPEIFFFLLYFLMLFLYSLFICLFVCFLKLKIYIQIHIHYAGGYVETGHLGQQQTRQPFFCCLALLNLQTSFCWNFSEHFV